MTVQTIQSKVHDIAMSSDDDEHANMLEDALYKEFIEYVANSDAGHLSTFAQEVLKTKDIGFSRWYA